MKKRCVFRVKPFGGFSRGEATADVKQKVVCSASKTLRKRKETMQGIGRKTNETFTMKNSTVYRILEVTIRVISVALYGMMKRHMYTEQCLQSTGLVSTITL